MIQDKISKVVGKKGKRSGRLFFFAIEGAKRGRFFRCRGKAEEEPRGCYASSRKSDINNGECKCKCKLRQRHPSTTTNSTTNISLFCLFLSFRKLSEPPPPPSTYSRRLIWHTGHRARGVILASGPQITADLGGFAKGHADAGGAEEGVGGTVVFAEVEVHVGAWKVGMLVCFQR